LQHGRSCSGHAPRWWALIISGLLALITLAAPALLTIPNRLWTQFRAVAPPDRQPRRARDPVLCRGHADGPDNACARQGSAAVAARRIIESYWSRASRQADSRQHVDQF
jgi:hypothetical protein